MNESFAALKLQEDLDFIVAKCVYIYIFIYSYSQVLHHMEEKTFSSYQGPDILILCDRQICAQLLAVFALLMSHRVQFTDNTF